MIQERPDIPSNARYTAAEAAGLLGVAVRTVYRWHARGLLDSTWSEECAYCRKKGKAEPPRPSRLRFTGASIVRAWTYI